MSKADTVQSIQNNVMQVLAGTVELLRAAPAQWILLVVVLFGVRNLHSLFPFQNMTGVALYATSWTVSFLISFLRLVVFLAVLLTALRVFEKRPSISYRTLPLLIKKAFPYALTIFFVANYILPWIAFGISKAGDLLRQPWLEPHIFHGASFISAVLVFWFQARLGMVFWGIVTGVPISFKQSWRLTGTKQWVLFSLVLVCSVTREISGAVIAFLPVWAWEVVLLTVVPYLTLHVVFFWVVAVVFYNELAKGRLEDDGVQPDRNVS